MSHEIEWTAAALRALRKLDRPVARRLLAAITKLGADPRPPAARMLTGEPAGTMRLRVGDYRVVYVVQDDVLLVTIVKLAHRREVYRGL